MQHACRMSSLACESLTMHFLRDHDHGRLGLLSSLLEYATQGCKPLLNCLPFVARTGSCLKYSTDTSLHCLRWSQPHCNGQLRLPEEFDKLLACQVHACCHERDKGLVRHPMHAYCMRNSFSTCSRLLSLCTRLKPSSGKLLAQLDSQMCARPTIRKEDLLIPGSQQG